MLADQAELDIVGEASNGTTAVQAITDKRPDLLLLDIQMPGKDGFEVLRNIAGVHQPVVVFITAHDEHAIRAFEVEAIDYVLKPVVEDRLHAAVRRAVSRLREQRRGDLASAMTKLLERVDRARDDGRVPVKTERGVTLIPATDIQWVEADGDLVTLHTAKGCHVLRTTMADIESRLATPPFTRVHRSAIVNVDCIQEIQPLFKGDYVIVLKSGAQIRTGRTHRANVQALMRGL
jgi:two-component system LytT family response regulator